MISDVVKEDQGKMEDLAKFEGKILKWVTYDEDSEMFYLFFEGMEAIAVEGFTPIDDGKKVASEILQQKLGHAQKILELKRLIDQEDAPRAPSSKVPS